MIFEPKTDFSERDISLDTLNEERRFWAKEGDSKTSVPGVNYTRFTQSSLIPRPNSIGYSSSLSLRAHLRVEDKRFFLSRCTPGLQTKLFSLELIRPGNEGFCVSPV
ncbi:hypothetical protein HY003_03445 [Candidatus Saccharibacteria bacterium]|nr:hypothetical protein [Candidatus Saccharibacteria bacterium]